MRQPRVLVVDDKENILKLFERILGHDFDLTIVEDGAKAASILAIEEFDVVVSDIRMPGLDGVTLLHEIKRSKPALEVILMTAYGSVASAVEAMKAGAYDYLTKPFDPDEARLLIERAAERKRLREEAENLRRLVGSRRQFGRLVGESESMRMLFAVMERAARTDATVLVTGESGTGKELTARAIHDASRRAERPFVAVNCGAIPDNLIEAELFGHAKGAFTGAIGDKRGLFEEADGGTLFLDEIGDLPQPLQVKLTRALQERSVRRIGAPSERPVDVRLIAATNADLKAALHEGRFREDLYYR
ncbi:MAG: sigma-54 dependent transcriptional regulator, partial [Candidatus Methylomirabilis sp.]|nr:sigma-54 dependent transcriptional regulator [Deltaproteobacteria bacterium]